MIRISRLSLIPEEGKVYKVKFEGDMFDSFIFIGTLGDEKQCLRFASIDADMKMSIDECILRDDDKSVLATELTVQAMPMWLVLVLSNYEFIFSNKNDSELLKKRVKDLEFTLGAFEFGPNKLHLLNSTAVREIYACFGGTSKHLLKEYPFDTESILNPVLIVNTCKAAAVYDIWSKNGGVNNFGIFSESVECKAAERTLYLIKSMAERKLRLSEMSYEKVEQLIQDLIYLTWFHENYGVPIPEQMKMYRVLEHEVSEAKKVESF